MDDPKKKCVCCGKEFTGLSLKLPISPGMSKGRMKTIFIEDFLAFIKNHPSETEAIDLLAGFSSMVNIPVDDLRARMIFNDKQSYNRDVWPHFIARQRKDRD